MDVLVFIEDHLVDQEEGMKNLIAGFLNQVMLAEALQQARAAQYERTDARKAHRNGYKERSLKTWYGDPILRKPQFREVPFETQVFGRYAQVGKNSGQCCCRVVSPGRLNEENLGDRQSSGHRSALPGFGLSGRQGTR